MQEDLTKRNKYKIYIDVLEAARNETIRKGITNSAMMNHCRVTEHLKNLQEKGLVEKNGRLYKTNERGLEAISLYQKMTELLPVND